MKFARRLNVLVAIIFLQDAHEDAKRIDEYMEDEPKNPVVFMQLNKFSL